MRLTKNMISKMIKYFLDRNTGHVGERIREIIKDDVLFKKVGNLLEGFPDHPFNESEYQKFGDQLQQFIDDEEKKAGKDNRPSLGTRIKQDMNAAWYELIRDPNFYAKKGISVYVPPGEELYAYTIKDFLEWSFSKDHTIIYDMGEITQKILAAVTAEQAFHYAQFVCIQLEEVEPCNERAKRAVFGELCDKMSKMKNPALFFARLINDTKESEVVLKFLKTLRQLNHEFKYHFMAALADHYYGNSAIGDVVQISKIEEALRLIFEITKPEPNQIQIRDNIILAYIQCHFQNQRLANCDEAYEFLFGPGENSTKQNVLKPRERIEQLKEAIHRKKIQMGAALPETKQMDVPSTGVFFDRRFGSAVNTTENSAFPFFGNENKPPKKEPVVFGNGYELPPSVTADDWAKCVR